jgi:putative hydrolase
MIDLHTHSFLSDGVLIPSELARRADAAGYEAIAITDHADHSNIGAILSGITRSAKVLTRYWNIFVLAGVELTHIPLETFEELTNEARKMGAQVVVAHGESPVEPVLPGTNRAAILAGVDILAHPGYIKEEDVELAAEKGVYLEITARRGHNLGNKHVFEAARKTGAKMVLNTDSHLPEDLLTQEKINTILGALTTSQEIKTEILQNSKDIITRLKK